jgi:hypothetical protein
LREDCYDALNTMLKETTPGDAKKIKSPKIRNKKTHKVEKWEWFEESPLLGTLTVK